MRGHKPNRNRRRGRRGDGCEVCTAGHGCDGTADVYMMGRWWCQSAADRHDLRGARGCAHAGYRTGRCGWCGQVVTRQEIGLD